MSDMKVLVLAPYRYDTAPGQRFRIEQWMPLLEKDGVSFDFDAFMSDELQKILYKPGQPVEKARFMLRDTARRLGTALDGRRYDVVFLHREAAMLGPAWIERLLRWRNIPFVYEFDDAIYVRYVSPSNGLFSYLKFPEKTATICALADHVIVGNEVLRQYAAPHNPNVTIVPTTIDTDKYSPLCKYELTDGEIPTIGWSGSYSTIRYLEPLIPAFVELAKKRKFRIEVIGAKWQPEIPGVAATDIRSREWSAATEVEDLARIGVGLMPIPDESWARGKCALKALQYMALGIPTVVSPVGVNADVVGDGVNGLHARTTADWVGALDRLLGDAALRRRLGTAGRVTVENEYSARAQAPRVRRVLDDVVAARRSRAQRAS